MNSSQSRMGCVYRLSGIVCVYPLPSHISLGTGFVLRRNVIDNNVKISKQIDIIIYDNRISPVFSEGDFIITTHDAVRGIIEVKAKMYLSNFKKKITKSKM